MTPPAKPSGRGEEEIAELEQAYKDALNEAERADQRAEEAFNAWQCAIGWPETKSPTPEKP